MHYNNYYIYLFKCVRHMHVCYYACMEVRGYFLHSIIRVPGSKLLFSGFMAKLLICRAVPMALCFISHILPEAVHPCHFPSCT